MIDIHKISQRAALYELETESGSEARMGFISGAYWAKEEIKPAIEEMMQAIKNLSFAAQTSGGTAGQDKGLMDAISQAEKVINKYANFASK